MTTDSVDKLPGFILVPNMASLAVRLLGTKYRYIFAEHLNYFTPRTLGQFAGRELKVSLKLLSGAPAENKKGILADAFVILKLNEWYYGNTSTFCATVPPPGPVDPTSPVCCAATRIEALVSSCTLPSHRPMLPSFWCSLSVQAGYKAVAMKFVP